MTDHTDQSELKQRKGTEKVDKQACEITKADEEVRTTWQTVKYYFNRFRYYHFIVADTVDKYASAACLWLINLYLKFILGVGPEPASVLTEED